MKIRWMVWILLFALLVVLVSGKKSHSKSKSHSKDKSDDKDSKSSHSKSKSHSKDKSDDKDSKKGHSKSKSHSKDKSDDKDSKNSHSKSKSHSKDKSDDKDSKKTHSHSKSKSHSKDKSHDKDSKKTHSHSKSKSHWKSHDKDTKKTHSHSHSHSKSHSKGKSHSKDSSRDKDKKWKWSKPGKISWDLEDNDRFKKGKEGGWRNNKDRKDTNVKFGCQCSAKGDPHFTTCDGRTYDFQGKCTYTLVTDGCNGQDKTIEVLIATEPWKKSKATVTKEVMINLYKDGVLTHELKFDRERGTMFADYAKCFLPRLEENIFDTNYKKDKVIFELLGRDMVLEWNYEHSLVVHLGDEFRERTCGLCGNYNEETEDDLTLSDGTVVGNDETHTFGESWRAAVDSQDEKCAPEDNGSGTCEMTESVRQMVEGTCNRLMTEDIFTDCYAKAASQIDQIINNCIFDLCMDPSTEKDACEYAEQAAGVCADVGFTIDNWMKAFCGNELCTGGKVYRTNHIGDRSCSNPADEPFGTPSSGCFCPDNWFLNGATCVTLEGCGCSYKGFYLKRGQRMVVRKCKTFLECMPDGTMVKEDISCHENAFCNRDDGKEQCTCKNGFEGDGQTCTLIESPNTIGVGCDGELQDSSFTSSTQEDGVNSWDGRLNCDKCWKPAASDDAPYLKVALLEEFRIQGIRLQACPDGDCSISEFSVYYSKDGEEFKKAETFENVEIKEPYSDFMLQDPVDGVQYVKIHAKNADGCIGLRMEVIGERSNCKTGFHPKLRSCYMFVPDEKQRQWASHYCSRHGAYLVEIFNKEENDYITSISQGKHLILGINDEYHEGTFINEHGSGEAWLNFPADHQVRDDHDCVMMNEQGSWYDVKCWKKTSFVCENGGGNDCPEDWQNVGGGCYKYIEEKLSFSDANERCLTEGGHIAEITSIWENKAVTQVSNYQEVWIAAADIAKEGEWLLFPSQRSMSFTSWAGNEPNDWSDGEDCAITNWNGNGMWNDVPCALTFKVVCERGQNIHHQVLDVCDGNPCNGGDCIGYYNYAEEKADFFCKCKKGHSGPRCNDAECNCFAWGDPHFGTCDQVKYDYQGKCSYVMAQDGCNDPASRTFQVVSSTQDFPKYPGTTSVKTIYISLDYVNGEPTTNIRLDQGRKSYINDVFKDGEFSLASKAEVFAEGGKLIFQHPNGLKISWNGDKRIDLKMDGTLMGKVCGMCGNFNGIKADDITDANGNSKLDKDEINNFGNSWAFGEQCAPPETPEDIDTICAKADENIRNSLSKALAVMDGELFEKCREAMDAEAFDAIKHALKMDFCPTGDMGSLCGGMKYLQNECFENQGSYVCWDMETRLCVPDQIGLNEEYYCGEGGERRCGESEEAALARLETVDGVFCKDGFLRLNQDECVLEAECGCKYQTAKGETFVLKPDEIALDSCTTKYSCVFNEQNGRYTLQEQVHSCHTAAECEKGRCVCGNLYEGDGYNCKYVPGPDIEDLEGNQLGVSCTGWIAGTAFTLNPKQELKKAGRLCKKDEFFIPPPEEEDPFIEVDLTYRTPVVAIITRGWLDGNCWPESVSVWYSNDRDAWDCAKQDGSEDCKEYFISYQRRITPIIPFKARYVRIRPKAAEGRKICLQIDLFGGNKITCPPDYQQIGRSCYLLVENKFTWDKAASFCAQKDGYLVEISSYRENRVVKQLAGDRTIFSGLRQESENGNFIYPKGSPTTIFSAYAEFEPNVMMQTARCMSITDGLWYRTDCSDELTFVCEHGGDSLIKIPPGNRLGIQFGGKIPDSSLTSSTSLTLLPPYRGRLFVPGSNSAWSPEPTDQEPYIQVDLLTPFTITAIITQGRGDAPEYTKRFIITYSKDCENYNTFRDEADKAVVFNGNDDQNTQVLIIFEPSFDARCVRIYPQPEGNEVPIALRFELFGIYIVPDAPCMTSLLSDSEVVPDSNFVASSCEQAEDAINLDSNYCAKFARWSDNADVWWAPGADGHFQYIQVDLGKERIVRAIKLATIDGSTLPPFRVVGSNDGMLFGCLDYQHNVNIFPEFEGTEVVYELWQQVPLQYIRINPVCEGIPILKIDILGCDMEQEVIVA